METNIENSQTKTGVQMYKSICPKVEKMKIIFYSDFVKSESYRLSKLGTGSTHPSVRHIYGYGT